VKEYHDLVKLVMKEGTLKENRTGVDTISYFGAFYKIDLAKGYPLLTTKKVHTKSLFHELVWYLSGAHHIKDFTKKSGMWDLWGDENKNLETAYGRFWRRFPVPENGLEGEMWTNNGIINRLADTYAQELASDETVVKKVEDLCTTVKNFSPGKLAYDSLNYENILKGVVKEMLRNNAIKSGANLEPVESGTLDLERWVNVEEDGSKTFDQLQYVIDEANENPNSRRLIVNAWHPANAAISKLPPLPLYFRIQCFRWKT